MHEVISAFCKLVPDSVHKVMFWRTGTAGVDQRISEMFVTLCSSTFSPILFAVKHKYVCVAV